MKHEGSTLMPINEHFTKPPITEALIDMRVSLPQHAKVDMFQSMADTLKFDYPEQQSIITGMMNFAFGEQSQMTSSHAPTGMRLARSDNHYVVQATLEGFTFSVLAPYENWEKFRDEARRVWNIYRSIVAPTSINRVAVRYLNRFDISPGYIELDQFFRTFPEISSDLPQRLDRFFMQLFIPVPEVEATLIINQTAVPPPNPETVSVIIDLELFRENGMPQDESGLWNYFEQLRYQKNKAFTGCITDRTKELIR